MARSIRLHKTLGVNPRMTVCPRCGGNGDELALLGSKNRIYKCVGCGLETIGKPKGNYCTECSGVTEMHRELRESEKIMSAGPCSKCQDEMKQHSEIVKDGGVYWKCADCKAEGVIKKNEFTEAVRKQNEEDGVAVTGPVGVEFSKIDCPACSKPGTCEEK